MSGQNVFKEYENKMRDYAGPAFGNGVLVPDNPHSKTHVGIDGITTGIDPDRSIYLDNLHNAPAWDQTRKPAFTYADLYDAATGMKGGFKVRTGHNGPSFVRTEYTKNTTPKALDFQQHVPVYSDYEGEDLDEYPYFYPQENYISSPDAGNERAQLQTRLSDPVTAPISRDDIIDSLAHLDSYSSWTSPERINGNASEYPYSLTRDRTSDFMHEANHALSFCANRTQLSREEYIDAMKRKQEDMSIPYEYEYDEYTGKPAEIDQGAMITNLSYQALLNKLKDDPTYFYRRGDFDPRMAAVGTLFPKAYGTNDEIAARNRWLLQNPGFVAKYMGEGPFRYLSGIQNTLNASKLLDDIMQEYQDSDEIDARNRPFRYLSGILNTLNARKLLDYIMQEYQDSDGTFKHEVETHPVNKRLDYYHKNNNL